MGKVNYLLLDMSVLPEVYVKVIEAKGYLQSGEAANASQAVKMAGISCSAYYKYKDKIFEYHNNQCQASGQCRSSQFGYERALFGRGKHFGG